MPPYDGTSYHYNYNNLLPRGNPYRPLQLSATPAYSGGPMIGTALNLSASALYGLPQLMEQFGLRLPNAQVAMVAKPAKSSKTDMPEGSWKSQQYVTTLLYPL
ncbi:hypothetical protein Tco_1369865 [Tanacetum coccineum]